MSIDTHPNDTDTGNNEPTMSSLMADIVGDVEKLIGQQLALLRREIQEDIRQAYTALGMVAVGGAVVLIAGIALTFAIVYAVKAASGWSDASCFTLVGSCLAAIGGLVLYGGIQMFASINPVPTRSMEALQENVQCLTTPPKTSNAK